MDSEKHSTKQKRTQVEQDVLNRFKTEFEDTGRDPATLLPDDELLSVLRLLISIILDYGWDIDQRESWLRADRIVLQMYGKEDSAGVA